MKVTQVLAVAALTAVLALAANDVSAQGNGGNGGGGRRGQGGAGGPGGGNFDPAQMQQRMMERTKENLEITDETEWKAIEPLVQKVMDSRMSQMGGMARGMMGGRRGGAGGPGGGGADTTAAAPTRRPGMFGQPSPEAEALQRAIDSKASNAELKTAVAKYNEARKAKQAELEKAQADLRKVLSVRQEALAALNGLL